MSEGKQGYEKYIPTRLEWLVLRLNAGFRLDDLKQDRFSIFYVEGEDGETIQISVRYYDDVDGEFMRRWIEQAREAVLRLARRHGWDSWIKIDVDRKKLGP